jgi:hypothetical protein
MAYRNYTANGTYWTVRERDGVFWVIRIDPSGGGLDCEEVWGGYGTADEAGGVAAQLAYSQGRRDAIGELRGNLHHAIERIGLGTMPSPAPTKADDFPADLHD